MQNSKNINSNLSPYNFPKNNINNKIRKKTEDQNQGTTLILKIDLCGLEKHLGLPNSKHKNNPNYFPQDKISNIVKFETVNNYKNINKLSESTLLSNRENLGKKIYIKPFHLDHKEISRKRGHSLNRSLPQINNILDINENTLVLGLNETLVCVKDHKIHNTILPQYEFFYRLNDEEDNNLIDDDQEIYSKGYLIARPGLFYFLNEVKKYFDEIIIFTSKKYSYAKEVLKIINKKNIITKIFSIKECVYYKNGYYKDFNKLKSDLAHTIILDNCSENVLSYRENRLQISKFEGNPKDIELLKILPILQKLSKVDDVRHYIKNMVVPLNQKIKFNYTYDLLKINKKSTIIMINKIMNNYFKNKNNNNNHKGNETEFSNNYNEVRNNNNNEIKLMANNLNTNNIKNSNNSHKKNNNTFFIPNQIKENYYPQSHRLNPKEQTDTSSFNHKNTIENKNKTISKPQQKIDNNNDNNTINDTEKAKRFFMSNDNNTVNNNVLIKNKKVIYIRNNKNNTKNNNIYYRNKNTDIEIKINRNGKKKHSHSNTYNTLNTTLTTNSIEMNNSKIPINPSITTQKTGLVNAKINNKNSNKTNNTATKNRKVININTNENFLEKNTSNQNTYRATMPSQKISSNFSINSEKREINKHLDNKYLTECNQDNNDLQNQPCSTETAKFGKPVIRDSILDFEKIPDYSAKKKESLDEREDIFPRKNCFLIKNDIESFA